MTMPTIKQPAFAAIMDPDSKRPHIMSWTVSGSAQHVRWQVGKAWCQEDPANGWKAAKIEGVRVVKITMMAQR